MPRPMLPNMPPPMPAPVAAATPTSAGRDHGEDSPAVLRGLVSAVARIEAARAAGDLGRLLHGTDVAVLAPLDGGAAAIVEQALIELGARVIRPAIDDRLGPATAALLGRLYTMIYCDAAFDASTAALRRASGRPVLCGLAAPGAPSRLLGELLAARQWCRDNGCQLPLWWRAMPAAPDLALVQRIAVAAGVDLPVRSHAGADERVLLLEHDAVGALRLRVEGLSPLEEGAWLRGVERYRQRVIQAAFLVATLQ